MYITVATSPGPPEPLDLEDVCERVFPRIAPIAVRAWPNVQDWIGEVVPEHMGVDERAFREIRALGPGILKRTLYPEDLTTIYSVDSPSALAKMMLASFRHSEFPAVFFPRDLGKQRIGGLLHTADHYAFGGWGDGFVDIDWMIGIEMASSSESLGATIMLVASAPPLSDALREALLDSPNGSGTFQIRETRTLFP